MEHQLKLFVRDNTLDARFLIVTDISAYHPSLPVSNDALYVQLPGFDDAIACPSVKGKTLGLTSNELIEPCSPDALKTLPDGLYTLTYSVAPNSKVLTVVYHYRTTLLKQQVLQRIALLDVYPDPHTVDNCGNVVMEKEEKILLRCVLLLQGLDANLCEYGDYQAAKDTYVEVEALLASINKEC